MSRARIVSLSPVMAKGQFRDMRARGFGELTTEEKGRELAGAHLRFIRQEVRVFIRGSRQQKLACAALVVVVAVSI